MRQLTCIASGPLIRMLPFSVLTRFVFGGFGCVMISVVIIGIISHFDLLLRRNYGLDDEVNDPTKPESFY